GVSKEDMTKLSQKGMITNDGNTELQATQGKYSIMGGVGLCWSSDGSFVAKRRDIYGEECFVSNPNSLFPPKSSKDRRDSMGSVSGYRESRSRDRRESLSRERMSPIHDSPSSSKSRDRTVS